MRRRIEKNRLILIALFFVAIFTGLSFIFDQNVVQQENKIRQELSNLSNKKIGIQDRVFIQNSLINISKEIKYLVKIQQNVLDNLFVHRPWFEDHLILNLENEKGERFTSLRGGKEAFERLLEIYKSNYLEVFNVYNQTVKEYEKIIDSFKNNQIFIEISKEYDLNLSEIDILKKYLITKDELLEIPIDKYIRDIDRALPTEPSYILYSNYRERMHEFSNIALYTLEIAEDIGLLQLEELKLFKELSTEFAKTKNRKNLYILLSIFFQILALTAILVLFKMIVNIEKK